MAIRVLRLIEYTYEDMERAERDMANWGMPASGTKSVPGMTIRSAILPLTTEFHIDIKQAEKINNAFKGIPDDD